MNNRWILYEENGAWERRELQQQKILYSFEDFQKFLNKSLLGYVIGTLQRVNKKISHFEMGLKRCDSGDLVSKEILLFAGMCCFWCYIWELDGSANSPI